MEDNLKTYRTPAWKKRLGLIMAGVVWLAAIACGMGSLYDYQTKPGASANAHSQWPSASCISVSRSQPTLIMFAHPLCPCSRASLGDLSQIVARNQGKVATYVVFAVPARSSIDWTHTDLCQTAEQIRGVTVLFDVAGVEAKRFGARTSGQVILYDAQGRLMFNGGITSGRSHFGDSAGSDTITSLLRSEHPHLRSTPVFGCSLID